MINELFAKWLTHNHTRFQYKPIQISPTSYIFEGIIENIYLLIGERVAETMICFDDKNGENYDHISLDCHRDVQFIETKGYTDIDWLDEYKRYFLTYEEMVYATLFEPIIEYCKKYFVDDNHLYLINLGGTTLAFIGDLNEEKKLHKYKDAQIDKLKIFL